MTRPIKPPADPKLSILRAKARRERLALAAEQRADAEARARLAARARRDARAGRYAQRTSTEEALDLVDTVLRTRLQAQQATLAERIAAMEEGT